jgi:hypothetical protein
LLVGAIKQNRPPMASLHVQVVGGYQSHTSWPPMYGKKKRVDLGKLYLIYSSGQAQVFGFSVSWEIISGW